MVTQEGSAELYHWQMETDLFKKIVMIEKKKKNVGGKS